MVRRRKARCGGEEERSLEMEVRVVGRETNEEFKADEETVVGVL